MTQDMNIGARLKAVAAAALRLLEQDVAALSDAPPGAERVKHIDALAKAGRSIAQLEQAADTPPRPPRAGAAADDRTLHERTGDELSDPAVVARLRTQLERLVDRAWREQHPHEGDDRDPVGRDGGQPHGPGAGWTRRAAAA